MKPDRREFLALGVGALAVATLPRALGRGPTLVRRQIPVMGTVAEVVVLHRDDAWAQRGIDAAFAELRRVEASMTRFRPDSDVGRINDAGCARVGISTETAEVLTAAVAWAERSGGHFDPCVGSASALWDVGHRDAPPSQNEVRRFADREWWRTLEVESGDAPHVTLHAQEARVDLGGIAKGFGVDKAAEALRDMGLFNALVNVGGDLVALGTGPNDEPWSVGVRSPDRAADVLEVLRVSDAAVATSGDYLQYFQHGGRRYHHLLDPTTGEPRRTLMRSLTIHAASCVHADAAATALFGASDTLREKVENESGVPVRVIHAA